MKKKNSIFENPLVSKASKSTQLELLGILALELAEACESETKEECWAHLNRASIEGHPMDCPAFNALYGAVAPYLAVHGPRARKRG